MLSVYDALQVTKRTVETILAEVPIDSFPDERESRTAAWILREVLRTVVEDGDIQKKIVPIRFSFRPAVPHIEYGKDLLAHGLFVAPYKYCLFTWPERFSKELTLDALNRGLKSSQVESTSHSLLVDLGGENRRWLVVGFSTFPTGTFVDTLAFLDEKIAAESTDGGGFLNFIPLNMHHVYSYRQRFTGGQIPERAVIESDMATTVTTTVGCVAALASSGVEVAKPTEREIKKALRHPLAKRQQYPDIHVTIGAPRSATDGTGRTHASPVPHWRRGHIRHIVRDGEVVKIPIPPCLVNASDEARVAVKEYVVKDGTPDEGPA